MGSRAGRAWRGILAAAFSVFVAALSHSFAAGDAAPLLGVVLALTVALPVCVLLAGRKLSWMRLSLAVVASQFVFHALLQIGVGEAGRVAPGPVGAGMADHMHAVMPAMLPALHAHHMASPAMWAGHAVAAVLTIAAFGAGERALRALLDLVGWSFVALVLLGVPESPARRVPLSADRTAVLSSLSFLSVAPRRGPPVIA
jgi:hypothetical protein